MIRFKIFKSSSVFIAILSVTLSIALSPLLLDNHDIGHAKRSSSDSVSRPIAKISVSNLPIQAIETLRLIRKGGPFPYRKDGTTFQNRERILPLKPRGYYKEYTVKTPERRDRGARRIVAGSSGEFYYTDDHYRTFKRIME